MNFDLFRNLYVLSRNALITLLNVSKLIVYIYKKINNFIKNAFNYLIDIEDNKA